MKIYDSMPNEEYWNSLFNIPQIIEWLGVDSIIGPIVEIGCGYGTFTIPIAKIVKDQVLAFDIDPQMIEITSKKAHFIGLNNIKYFNRDIIEMGTGVEANSIGMVLFFNILHFDERRIMLEEASRILKESGKVAIIHWRKDIETPRGPMVQSRPDEETILNSIKGLNLIFQGNSKILEPYHWGIQLVKENISTE